TNITINRNMTIQGLSQNGTIINGTDTNWIFTITSDVNVTICNLTFTNGIAYDGGAILNHGILSISDCTFTENTATHWGGAIYSDSYQKIMSLTDCTFTKNTALWGGGAIAYLSICNITNCTFMYNSVTGAKSWCGGAIGAYSLSNSTVTGCTFIGNSVDPISTSFGGGAIYVYNAALTANYNRFYNNSARLGSAFAFNTNSNVLINAENNWWGSNVDPTTVPNLIYGPVDANPWVILTVNATPSTINNGETSTITADFNHINGGGDLVGGHIPDESITLDIPWGSFTNSGISHSLTGNTVAGAMSATFYASEGALNPSYNPVQVIATADDYTTSAAEAAYISINPAANLNITNTANMTAANVGNIVRYNITITNNGPDNVTVITLKDLLPVGTELVSVSSAYDILSLIPSGVELTWNNILASLGVAQLQPGMSVSIWVDARILASAAGTTLGNKANITSNEYPYFNESTANVYINQAIVELNKTANNTRPNVGETVLFTIVAKNTGPNTANNLIVTDTL
ncbi:MAG: repeat-containing protein, partial [Methanobacterium sp. Maddingley MBC34]